MDGRLALGILTGLGAALCQASSYLATRHFVQVRSGGTRQLMVLGHVIMGILSIAVLPWIWPRGGVAGTAFISPLIQCSVWCVLGQLGLTVLLRYIEPSRVSPMLAFKLVILALLTIGVARQPITSLQWIAITLCIAGAMALNYASESGKAMSLRAIGLLVFTCIAYSVSDWNIARLVNAMGEMERWRAFICATLASYTLCGIAAAVFLPWYGSTKRIDWQEAAPFGILWLLAMLLLFTCFGMVGVVYGNILQSTRGLISLGLGALSVKLGFHHIESATSRTVFAKRFIATLLMTAAVVLYALGKQA
jgi:hypothetical protein